jgi:hypothetical protein
VERGGLGREEGEEGVVLRLQQHEATGGCWIGRRERERKINKIEI